ncbi:hypothetical_protein [Leishmania major strain Friedlin]|nr:hypothetical_protein [Leishmania major strain Friedlin]
MLSRHGTRLDLGTAEDIAELNAAESHLRAAYKSSTVVGSSSSGGSPASGGGGYYTRAAPAALGHPQASGNDTYGGTSTFGSEGTGGGACHASPATAATVTTDFAGPVVGRIARSSVAMPYGAEAASGAAAPPHVNLGYTARQRSSGPIMAGSASTPSSASGYPQRVLYADMRAGTEEGSPSGSTMGMSSSGAAMRVPGGGGGATEVAPSSSSGMRATAPAFYRPQMSFESGGGREEIEKVPEPESDVERGRSSIRGLFAPPATATTPAPAVAAAAVGSRLTRPPHSQRAHGSPYIYHAPHDSAALAHAGAMRGGRVRGQGGRGDEEEDSEEASARPSRVSGRYHFPRADAP